MNTYRLKIENYHSISKADIALNGITVLAGINGCGKSTLARWLYYIVKGANGYDQNLFEDYRTDMDEIVSQYTTRPKDGYYNTDLNKIISKAKTAIMDYPYTKLDFFTKIEKIVLDTTSHFFKTVRDSYVTMNIENKDRLLNYLNIKSEEGETDDKTLGKYYKKQTQKIKETLDYYIKSQHTRPRIIFSNHIDYYYNESDNPSEMSFKEDGVEILNKNSIGTILGLKSAIYVDTPMSVNAASNNPLWEDFRTNLQYKISNTKKNEVVQRLLSSIRNIMGGSVTDEESIFGDKELSFKRASDNLTIKLEQMATGIKSFAYLDRLLEYGYLTQGNILILDEPEAHLHPQWIVEFARMLVKIHKETGLFIMLASHDPDMVSAIRYIAEKEEVLDDTTFYLAEQDKNAETFSYKELGHDIEPIFASFNKSFDLIEKYGVDNGR